MRGSDLDDTTEVIGRGFVNLADMRLKGEGGDRR